MISAIDSTSSSLMAMQQMQGQRPPQPPSFSQIDTDGSGGVDKIELSESLANSPFAEQLQEADYDKIFAMLDTDSDGILSQSETEEGQAKIGQYMADTYGITGPGKAMEGAPPPPPPSFSDIDIDGSGDVDESELAELLGNSPMAEQLQDGDLEEIFAMLDSDGDGVLSESELSDGHLKVGEYMQDKYGITPPDQQQVANTGGENALATKAINSYLQNSETASILKSTLVDILE